MNIFEDHGLDLLFHKMDEQVLSIESTLQLIVSERVSVSRFGDGEINYVLKHSVKFTPLDIDIRNSLIFDP